MKGDARLAEPNYTQIPNLLLDHMSLLSDAEFRVIMCVCRQTFGFHRNHTGAKVSTTFIAKATGMSTTGVVNGVKRLLERRLLEREPDGQGYLYFVATIPLNKTGQPPNGVGGSNPANPPTALGGPPNGVGEPPPNGVGGNKERGKERSKDNGADAPRRDQPENTPPRSKKRELTDGWCEGWRARFGGPYDFKGVADGKAADELLKLYGPAQLLAMARKAWDRVATDFNCKHAMTLRGFASRFNEIRLEIGELNGGAVAGGKDAKGERVFMP